MKKIWEKPKLIILLRGRPEELVLADCKASNFAGGRNNQNNACLRIRFFGCWGNCSSLGAS